MTLFEKSQEILELPRVLELLAVEAVSESAKNAARALRPVSDKAEIERRLSETTAAKKMMVTAGSPGFSAVTDVTATIKRADAGGMLNTRELLAVAGVLRTARLNIEYASGEKNPGFEKSDISYLFFALKANKYLEERITNSIIGDDELADSASSELADIRRAMRVAGDKVRQSLQKIISSPSYSKALQEPIITMKNGRYVVPVKAEHKSAVPGLVHDISSSGATLFIEPMSAVKANNEIRELLAREEKEIDRILMELSAEASNFGEDILLDFKVLTELDLIFAKAKLSFKQDAGAAAISDKGEIILKRARHPLLPKDTAVPIDVNLGGEFDTLVITGPNTGGKTVSLKTIGIMCLMTECGLHIPTADGSVIPAFEKVLADIGDEQSIEQSLSTFSAHMTNIVSILKECGEGTLALFDELGSGTDPAEGAALAMSVIEYARNLGTKIAATTHYAELKIYAMTKEGVMNASCEFDVETLKPTYRLLLGIPGKSNAFAISRRLGLPEEIIEDAVKRRSAEDAEFDEAIENLEAARKKADVRRAEAEELLREAERNAKEAEKLKNRSEKELEGAAKAARREAERIISEAREAADRAFKEIDAIRKSAASEADWQRINEAKTNLRRSLNETEEKLRPKEKEEVKKPTRPAVAGDTVEIISIGTRAQVISVQADGTLELQAGIMKVAAKQKEVRVVEEAKPQTKKPAGTSVSVSKEAAKMEIDLRGFMADEAVMAAERFIDTAAMRRLHTVTIIHGKGTGALRQAIQQSLRRNPQVKSFRLGRYGEGESGVTVVELK